MDLNELKKLINEEVKRTRQRNLLKEVKSDEEEIKTNPAFGQRGRSKQETPYVPSELTPEEWAMIKGVSHDPDKTETVGGTPSEPKTLTPQTALLSMKTSQQNYDDLPQHFKKTLIKIANNTKNPEIQADAQNLRIFFLILDILRTFEVGKEQKIIKDLSQYKDTNFYVIKPVRMKQLFSDLNKTAADLERDKKYGIQRTTVGEITPEFRKFSDIMSNIITHLPKMGVKLTAQTATPSQHSAMDKLATDLDNARRRGGSIEDKTGIFKK